MSLKIIFMGTPAVACPFLRGLTGAGFEVFAVITQPDKKAGRGLVLTSPAVKNEAVSLNIPVYQPSGSAELKQILEDLKPDLAVVVAYGKLLKKEVLSIPRLGFINAHFSLLPKYRGAAPVRRAVLNGERETGMTVFKIDEGMDTGPLILQKRISIGEKENAISLFDRLGEAGRELLVEAVKKMEDGTVVSLPQQGEVSYAPKIEIKDTWLDFFKPAGEIYNAIRAFCFDPRARFVFSYKDKKIPVQIISAFQADGGAEYFQPGTVCGFEKGKGIFIKCQEGRIFIEKVKPEGKKEIGAFDYFINGLRLKEGDAVFKKEN